MAGRGPTDLPVQRRAARLLTTVGELSAPDSHLASDHGETPDRHRTEERAIPAMQQYISLRKGGLGTGTLDWLTEHGWDTQAHDHDAYAASLGRPAPDPSGATLITAVTPGRRTGHVLQQ